MLYFGYGSNLNLERLVKRCKSAQYLFNAELRDYKLSFMENNRGKVVANIEEDEGSVVKGAVFYIEDEDRVNLDRAEGHPRVYKRNSFAVMYDDRMVVVESYKMEKSYREEKYFEFGNSYKFKKKKRYVMGYEEIERSYGIPEEEYLKHIIKGYEDLEIGSEDELREIFNKKEYEGMLKKGENKGNISTGDYVFTYGTLKRGEYNHGVLGDSEYIGEGALEGFDMFTNGSFPMIVEGDGLVFGEVYKVSDLDRVDMLEGYVKESDKGMYLRRKKEIIMDDDNVECWVYIWNRDLDRCEPILNGEF